MDQLNLSKCTATGKTRFSDAGKAKEAILKIKAKKNDYNSTTGKRIKRRGRKASQCRQYYCKHCRGFHLTSHQSRANHIEVTKVFNQRVRTTQGLVITIEEAIHWKADSLPFPNN
jgi:hypothetical protein